MGTGVRYTVVCIELNYKLVVPIPPNITFQNKNIESM